MTRATRVLLLSALALLLLPPPTVGASLVSMPPDGAPPKVTAYLAIPEHAQTMLTSSYCLSGTTAMGTRVGMGTIAVDPQQIPFGTRLYVPGYGYGTALDDGPAIHWDRLDLWLPWAHECDASTDWGMRTVTVIVYGKPHLSRHVPPRLRLSVQ